MNSRGATVKRIGKALERSMRACVSSEWIPIAVKWLWINLLIGVLRRRFMRSFRPEIVTLYGCKLSGGPTGSSLNTIIFFRDVFEPNLSDIITRIVGEGDICVDAGANVGYFTLIMASKVGPSGRVISIEAAPANVRLLKSNVEINGFCDRVEVIEAAVSDHAGEVKFYLHPENDMLCRLELPDKTDIDYWLMGRKWKSIVVRSDTLSALVGPVAEKVAFIKLDVEGMESRINDEIIKNFTHDRLCIAMEAKQPNIRSTLEPFEKAGFYAYNLHNDYRWVLEKKTRPPTAESFADLYAKRMMVDILLSRCKLSL